MELRHLRYFVAVADAGSLTVAAEQKLHTSQPSLSRQIRDLEQEVGVQLMLRGAQGIELTSAGKAFLDHARMALVQAEAAKEAALRAAQAGATDFRARLHVGGRNRLAARSGSHPSRRVSRHRHPPVERLLARARQGLDEAQARCGFHAAGRAHGGFELQARAHGPAGLRFSERPPPGIANSRRAAGHRERNFLSPVQVRSCGAPRRSGLFQPRRHRSQARPRGSQRRPRHLDDHVHARGDAAAGLHQALSARVDHDPSAAG